MNLIWIWVGFYLGEKISVLLMKCDPTQSHNKTFLRGNKCRRQNTHAARCVDSESVSSVCLPSLRPLHKREMKVTSKKRSVNEIVKTTSGPDHLLRGSASVLLRLCWDEADSLGLAGLLLARLSPPLRRRQINKTKIKLLLFLTNIIWLKI